MLLCLTAQCPDGHSANRYDIMHTCHRDHMISPSMLQYILYIQIYAILHIKMASPLLHCSAVQASLHQQMSLACNVYWCGAIIIIFADKLTPRRRLISS